MKEDEDEQDFIYDLDIKLKRLKDDETRKESETKKGEDLLDTRMKNKMETNSMESRRFPSRERNPFDKVDELFDA